MILIIIDEALENSQGKCEEIKQAIAQGRFLIVLLLGQDFARVFLDL